MERRHKAEMASAHKNSDIAVAAAAAEQASLSSQTAQLQASLSTVQAQFARAKHASDAAVKEADKMKQKLTAKVLELSEALHTAQVGVS